MYPISLVHEFPEGTWAENLAVRASNGHIITTMLSAPEIYEVDPSTGKADLVATLASEEVTGILGIVQPSPDTFYVAAGNYTIQTGESVKGSYGIWKIDLSKAKNETAEVEEVAKLPDAEFLNGLCVLDIEKGLILAADSNLFAVWAINVKDGSVDLAIQDPLMAATPPNLGINGLHIKFENKTQQRVLYYTNTGTGNLLRQPITDEGKPIGSSTITASGLTPDDFAFSTTGDTYIANNFKDQIVLLSSSSSATSVTANGTDTKSVTANGTDTTSVIANGTDIKQLKGPTSLAFGKGSDRKSLYISTCSGISAWLSGDFTVGASILKIDLGG